VTIGTMVLWFVLTLKHWESGASLEGKGYKVKCCQIAVELSAKKVFFDSSSSHVLILPPDFISSLKAKVYD
jgi:hypothetical protein